MTDHATPIPLPGSIPPPHGVATLAGAADPSSSVDVTVYLRPRTDHAGATSATHASESFLTRSQLAATRGAAPADLTAVENFARSMRSKSSRSTRLAVGSVSAAPPRRCRTRSELSFNTTNIPSVTIAVTRVR